MSYHLFKQKPLVGWWINRIGGYSILREGADRDAIRATVGILAAAERPVVMFPEGTWFRQNDRVGPLQEGLGLIVRQAAKQTERPILVHPVGVKYWLLGDPLPELRRRVEKLERGLGWLPRRGRRPAAADRPRRPRPADGEGNRALRPGQPGTLDERIQRLAAALIADLEKVVPGERVRGLEPGAHPAAAAVAGS